MGRSGNHTHDVQTGRCGFCGQRRPVRMFHTNFSFAERTLLCRACVRGPMNMAIRDHLGRLPNAG